MNASRANPQPLNPQALLRAELSSRCARNPRYSLRAFARASGISHTVLSLVMAGKRPLSKGAAKKLADFLALEPEARAMLLEARTQVFPIEKDIRQISLDTFAVIADWYHLAILSLLEIDGSRWDARFLARRLSITEIEAKLAMERLQRLSLVEERSPGVWKQSGNPIRFDNIESNAAARRYNRQLLEEAIDALENDPTDTRDISSITFAMDPEHLPYARKRIQAFRRELAAELQARSPVKAVYHLTVQFYPVTQPEPA